MPTLREESKRNWTFDGGTEQINAGSLQRIADATELMAKNHRELLQSRDRYKLWYEEWRAEARRFELSNSALRGVITKLKKKLANQEGT